MRSEQQQVGAAVAGGTAGFSFCDEQVWVDAEIANSSC